jgi:4,5-dihydroxyphthalate decarboxylase
MAATGADPLPYGIEPNRATLTALLDTARAQGIVTRRPDLESLFAPETLTLAG